MKKKKWIAMISALSMGCMMLAGCGKQDAAQKSSAENSQAADLEENLEETEVEETVQEPSKEDAKVEYIPGTKTDTEYVNESIGIKCTLSEDMVMATDEEINEAMGNYLDELYGEEDIDVGAYEMMAIDINTGGGFLIGHEKLLFSGISEKQYIKKVKKTLYETQEVVEMHDTVETELAGLPFTNYSCILVENDHEITETLYVKKVGNTMVVIAFLYFTQENYEQLLSCFSPLQNDEDGEKNAQETSEGTGEEISEEATDTGYINESLGIKCTMPEEMLIKTKDESYEMLAVDIEDNSSIMVVHMEESSPDIIEEQYIEELKNSYQEENPEKVYSNTIKTEIGGVPFVGFSYNEKEDEDEYMVTLFIKKDGDTMVIIFLTYYTQESYEQLLSYFLPL
ncbi:MAG: hypothetical protein Q4F24_09170 [Eubacteriales bacterium]|nr:hypothetical protein [Eubacteriales bacterium]